MGIVHWAWETHLKKLKAIRGWIPKVVGTLQIKTCLFSIRRQQSHQKGLWVICDQRFRYSQSQLNDFFKRSFQNFEGQNRRLQDQRNSFRHFLEGLGGRICLATQDIFKNSSKLLQDWPVQETVWVMKEFLKQYGHRTKKKGDFLPNSYGECNEEQE